MADDKKPIQFYFPKNAKKVYKTSKFRIQAQDNVYTVLPSDKQYKTIVAFLRKHKDNRDVVGGKNVFYEINPNDESGKPTEKGKLIDNILGMDKDQLRKLCEGDQLELMTKTHGELIALYLKQQEA